MLCFFVTSCAKTYEGSPGVGGALPSNFINIKDSSFTPATLTIAAGSTISFVNNTSLPKSIQGIDSNALPKKTIAAGSSYLFTYSNSGIFKYFLAEKPSITGTINYTP